MTELVWNPPTTQQVLETLRAGTRPPEALTRKVQEAGLRLVDPPAQAFSYYDQAANAFRRHTNGHHTEQVSNFCRMHSVWSMSYWDGALREGSGRLSDLVNDSLAKACEVSDDGRTIALAIPVNTSVPGATDVYCHIFTCVGGNHSLQRQLRLKMAGQGVYTSILRPVVRRFGFDIEEGRVVYKASRSLMGVTVERSVDVNQYGLFNHLIFGQNDPSFEYYCASIESIYTHLIGSAVITPEALGIDRDTWRYVGDPALLSDPAYYHFVDHVLRTANLRDPISRRNDDTVSKAIAMAAKRTTSDAISSLDNILEVEVVQAAARQKAEQALASQNYGNESTEVTTDALSHGMLELVGGKPATVRILAKQVEARARFQAAQPPQWQDDLSEAIDF